MATFNSPTDVVAGALAKSSDLNNLDAATAAAFALLPTNAGINAGTVNFAVDTGTANAYLVALPMTVTSYGDGLQVVMRPLNANTGACTINVDSLGVKSIKTESNSTPAANDIIAGVPIELRYSTTTGFFHILKNSAAQATAAAASAAAALVSQNAAAASESAAAGSASSASGSASAALVSQNAASASETAAGLSKTAAELAETNAETAETNAAASAAAALVSQNSASGSASTATTQAGNASVSAAAALVSENNAAASYDSFDDRYLGAKASDPSLDNDGNALITGAMYFNTTSSLMKVYSGSAWNVLGASEVAGDGIDVTFAAGQVTISVDLKANGGLVIEATELALDLGASSITGTLAVGDGGTGRITSTTAYGLLAAGTTATGAHQTLAAGLTTQILVGGGASALPAWGTDIPTAVTIGSAYIYRAGGTDVAVADGGTGVGTFTLNGILYGNTTTSVLVTAAATAAGQFLTAGATPFVPAWSTTTLPVTTTINQILFSSAANTVTGLATGNSGVLVTGGTGVPAIATDIPTAVTIGTKYIYRAEGTDIPVTDGGTGASTLALNGILYGNGTSAVGVTAIGAEGQILRVGASPFVPAWTTATFASTYVIGGLLHAATANAIAALAPGAIGSFLMSNGASAALSYLAAGAVNYCLVGAGVTTIPVWTAATGTGSPVLATSPTLVTPTIGVATATSINKVAITAPATSATLTVADGKTLTISNSLTLTATDGSTLAIGTGGTLGTAAYTAATAYEASGGIATHAALITGVHGLVFTVDKTLTVTESLTLNAHPVGGLSVATAANTVGALAVGATTEILVGGGAGVVPVWTAATGAGAPVRAGSPTFTGVPLSTTPAVNDNTTKIATTEFIQAKFGVYDIHEITELCSVD